ncbi:hypothetical protein PUMCH_002511 [Australozyma saopauloensis]|uniref:Vesicle tethering protein Uso1/P115-like head domain-containing protein n=1 Tax=Australozyma saopauloensis TaxID=291208 RepID=A0AAX4HA25_9ASCO|nr:hypothetical protein PUMCH_002511 [[Candida] saopauloensis]
MGYFNGILRQKDPVNNAEEVIQTYANRLQHATLMNDRKSAVKGLKSFSKDHREMVVQHGLRALLIALEKDAGDSQAVKAVLETLLILFLRSETSNEDQALGWISNQSRLQNGKYPSPLLVEDIEIDQFSMWIADEILSLEAHIQTFLTILQEHAGFQIRLFSLQLLEALVAARPVRAKESLINIPLAISTIVALLGDLNDPIRNETILLLMALVNNNFNIQKLVAFENTFERIFEIIEEEGGIRGSILVQDCLTLLTNLLIYNASNQKLFLETECVPKLARLISEPIEDDYDEGLKDDNGEPIPLPPIVWTEQRLQNMIVVLEICKSFVDPDNQQLLQNQQKLESSGIFYSVLRLIFSPVMGNSIRRTALQVAGDIMAENTDLQLKFSQLDVPYLDPSLPIQVQRYDMAVPAPVALVNWALLINSVHVFEIRLAAVHCLSCFFKSNSEAKLAFVNDQIKARSNPSYYQELQNALNDNEQSNQPEPSDSQSQPTPIANIFSTLMDFDTDVKLNPYSVWFAANILVNIIEDCPEARELVRSLKDGDSDNGEEVLTIIQAVAGKLTANLESSDPRIAIGCLMLLSFWLFEDFDAINDFLLDSSIIKSILGFLSKNSSESSQLVHGLATIFVGIVYEFSTTLSPIPRASLFELVTKALGADNYSSKVKQFKENPVFKNYDGSIETGFERDSTGLPELFFIPEYVELVKENFFVIKRALFRGPEFEPRVKLSHEVLEDLESKNAEFMLEIKSLKESSTAKEAELKKLIDETVAEQTTTTELLHKTQADLDESRASETEISDKLEKLAKELTESQNQRQKYEKSSEEYIAKYNALLKSLSKNEEALKRTTKVLAEVEEAKAKAEAGINKMSRELFQLSKQKADAETNISNLESKLSKLNSDHEKAVKELKEQAAMANRINDELRSKIRFLEENGGPGVQSRSSISGSEDTSVLQSKLRDLQNQLSEQQEENDNLLEKLRSAASVVLELRLKDATNKEQLNSLQTELAKAYEDLELYSQLLDEVGALDVDSKSTSEELIELRKLLREEIDSFIDELGENNTTKNDVDQSKDLKDSDTEVIPEKDSEEIQDVSLSTLQEKSSNNLHNSSDAAEEVNSDEITQEIPLNNTTDMDEEFEEKSLMRDAIGLLAQLKERLEAQKLINEKLESKPLEPELSPVPSPDLKRSVSQTSLVEKLTLDNKDEELQAAYTRIARLEGNIQALSMSAKESLTSFNSSRDSLQARVTELESIKSKLQEEISNLEITYKNDLAEKDEAFDDLEGSYFDLELLMSNAEKSKEELEIKFKQMKTEYIVKIGQLQDETVSLKKTLADTVADRDAISLEFAQLEKLSNKLDSELKAKEALLQAIADKGADLAAKDAIVIEIKERLASTIAQLGEAAQKIRSLSKEKEDFEKLHEETAKKCKESSQKILELEDLLKSKTEESYKAESDRKRLNALQIDKIQTSEVIEKQRNEISELKNQITDLEGSLKESLQTLEDERKTYATASINTTLAHTEQVAKLEESITHNQKLHDSDIKSFEEKAENRIQKLNAEIEDLRAECKELSERLELSEASAKTSEQNSKTADDESKATELHALQTSLEEAQVQLSEKASALATSEAKLLELTTSLKSQQEAASHETAELENQIKVLNSKVSEFEANRSDSSAHQQSLQEELTKQTDLANEAQASVISLEEQIDSLKLEVEDFKRTANEAENGASKEEAALSFKTAIEDLKSTLAEKDTQLQEAKAQNDMLIQHCEDLKSKMSQAEKQSSDDKAQSDLLAEAISRAEQLDESNRLLELQISEMRDAEKQLQEKVDQSESATSAASEKLTETISEKDAEIQRLLERLEQKEAGVVDETKFAAIPAGSTGEEERSSTTEAELVEVLTLCEEQEKTIQRLTRRLEALDLPISDSEELDLC